MELINEVPPINEQISFSDNGFQQCSSHDRRSLPFNFASPAKLSSLRWRPGSEGRVMASSDYDGVVTEYNLETKLPIFKRDEHGGRRVWSLDYSRSDPVLGASGSEDGITLHRQSFGEAVGVGMVGLDAHRSGRTQSSGSSRAWPPTFFSKLGVQARASFDKGTGCL